LTTLADELTVDLVVGSIGRFDHVRRLATSLAGQSHRNFSLIVIEQVDPAGVEALLAQFPDIRSQVLTSERGLSRARNRGLKECSADIIAFPDDDCWYDVDTLAKVAERFALEPHLDMLVGVIRTTSRSAFYRTPDSAMTLDRTNVWSVGCSAASFFRATAVDRIGTFDPLLGVGSGTPYLSGEETDFFLRGIGAGLRGMFDPSLTVRHPSPEETEGRLSPLTGRGYGMGMGVVLRRHSYHWSRALWASGKPLIGAGLALVKGQRELAQFRTAVAAGRFSGYFGHPVI
jgi:glycosyltransferase involved in cell wall biosynthesis